MKRWFAMARLRLRSLLRRDDVERDLDDELQFHVDQQTRENRARGMSESEARRAALVALGGLEQRKEQSRDARGTRAIEDLAADVRYTFRTLRRSAGFTAVTLLTLTLGIGATTAVFSVLDAVMFRRLPVRDPNGLVIVQRMSRAPDGNVSARALTWPSFLALRADSAVLARSAAVASVGNLSVRVGDRIDQLRNGALLISGDFFPMLGITPRLGRLVDPNDDRVDGGSPVVVLGYRYWASQLGADEDVIGRSLEVNGTTLTIVGVAPNSFAGVSVGGDPDLYVPMFMVGALERSSLAASLGPNRAFLSVMARLAPGARPDRASQTLTAAHLRERTATLGGTADSAMLRQLQLTRIDVLPGSQGLGSARRQFGASLLVLMTIVSVVLLIACANIASLFVARASAKRRELGVRLALGAERGRLVRQLLTESIVLALAGGALGVAVSRVGTKLLLVLLGDGRSPLVIDVRPDARILTFALLASLLTAALVGIVPALGATRLDVTSMFRGSPREGTTARDHFRFGRWLVVAQVALSIVLLVGAGLFVRGLIALQRVDLGFAPDNVVVMHIDPRRSGYSRARLSSLYQQVHAQVRALPGTTAAALADITPLSGSSSNMSVAVQGLEVAPGERAEPWVIRATPEYFRALGQPILVGSGLAPRFGSGDIVVNEAFARELAGNDALGRRVARVRREEPVPRFTMQVTGVVKDAVLRQLRERREPTVYLSFLGDTTMGSAFIVVRSAVAPAGVEKGVRDILQALDPRIEVLRSATLDAWVDSAMVRERVVATLATFFGALALFLSALGLYGLIAHGVTRRTNEIGVRIALGAPRDVVALRVLRDAFAQIAIGVAIGLPLSWLAAKVAARMLVGVPPLDVLTLASSVVVLVVVGLIASYLPARRAARIDPIIALRSE